MDYHWDYLLFYLPSYYEVGKETQSETRITYKKASVVEAFFYSCQLVLSMTVSEII